MNRSRTCIIAILSFLLGSNIAVELRAEEVPVEDETELVLDLLYTPIIPERYKSQEFFKIWDIKSKVSSFQWKDCGGSVAKVTEFKLMPDPLVFPGSLTVGFKAAINTTVESPLKANLTIEKKIGTTWVKVPCIGQFGSCVYDDICELLDTVQCPQPFVSAGVPCKCPFKQGSYDLSGAKFDVGAAAFTGGDYRVTGFVEKSGKKLACLDLIISVSP